MIILDTNVVSETFRPSPSRSVLEWLDANAPETLFLTSIVLAELRLDIALLPDSRCRHGLEEILETVLLPRFRGRILPFDDDASSDFAWLQSTAHAEGRTLPTMDGLIGAICRSHDFALATRNIDDFARTGIALINPWETH